MNAITQATAGQIKQISRFGGDAIEKLVIELGLDKDGAQLVIARGDEFVAAIRKAATTSLKDLSAIGMFENEKVRSTYNYPREYRRELIETQIERIAKLFNLDPQAAYAYAQNLPELPLSAEGWFAIPRWQLVAETYGLAVEHALKLIGEHRSSFINNHEGQLDSSYLKQSDRTIAMMRQIEQIQVGNILLIPAQFGLLHRGRSVRRARVCFESCEFGLGVFAIACMVLMHPARFVRWKGLNVVCSGDEFSLDADGDFSLAPVFYFSDDRLKFSVLWFNDANDICGSVSAFLPQ